MGTNCTSYCLLTRGWGEDPNSGIDATGRPVFLTEQGHADRVPKTYGPLMFKGLVMLETINQAYQSRHINMISRALLVKC